MEVDIVISGGLLLTMDDNYTVIKGSLIAIEGDKIVYVGQSTGINEQIFSAKKIIDATGCLVLPGLVNTHTHAPMVLFRGVADDLSLMEWLNNYIFPLEMKYVTKDTVYWGARLACAEMILSGTTTFCDGYFYPGRIARAAIESGLRIVLGLGFFDSDEDIDSAAKKHSATARRFIEKWQHISPLVTPALFPHAPYTCRPEIMRRLKQVADEYEALFITHLSETKEEVDTINERYGLTPVKLLYSHGILDERTIAVHCNWLNEEEIGLLASSKAKVSHNAESGMKLASGACPIHELLSRGITVGIGTDGCASNNDHDLVREMGTVAYLHKHITGDPTTLDARSVLALATRMGARVLGLEREIGSIEVGKKADIILIDTRTPRLWPLYNPYSQIVYAACGENVTTTICNGRILMENRRLVNLDLDEIMSQVESVAETIRQDELIRSRFD
ncbi:MAG: amidohydrolase [Syntrophales bacterium]|nr:amidohydrolase [Syntrophales bacterium]